MLAGGLQEEVDYDGHRWPMSTHEWGSRRVDPEGFVYCESFRLEGMLPVWMYAFSDALIEKRIWMAYGHNTTYVSYSVLRASAPVAISLRPLLTCRAFHSLQASPGWAGDFEIGPGEIRVALPDDIAPLRVIAPGMRFTPVRDWYWDFYLREEGERGLDTRADLFVPGSFQQTLAAGQSCAIGFTSETGDKSIVGRRHFLPPRAPARISCGRPAGGVTRWSSNSYSAADHFIVQRMASVGRWPGGESGGKTRPTIIAGYHWFADWGRDAMIALPGLTLATGRFDDAAEVLRTFARHEQDGLFPNNLPGASAGTAEYNTVDAGLWFIHALQEYRDATNDRQLIAELLPAVRRIIDAYTAGTRYRIGVDPADGLLRAADGSTPTYLDGRPG